MANKTVYFDYFEVWCHKLESDGETLSEFQFDLNKMLDRASKLSPKETMKNFRDEKARIQIVKYHKKSDIWELQLLRLREKSLPGLAKDTGEYEIIILEDGEYIGESSSVLYDRNGCILVMQRNVNGFTPSGVEEYLNSILKSNSIRRVILKPIIVGAEINKITSGKLYRNLTIGIAVNEQHQINNRFLTGVLKHFNNYEGTSLKIEMSVGKAKRDRTLSPGLTAETIHDLYESSGVTQLRTSIKDSEDTKAEKIDLLNDRRQDLTNFIVDKYNPLVHEKVFFELSRKYLDRRENNTIY